MISDRIFRLSLIFIGCMLFVGPHFSSAQPPEHFQGLENSPLRQGDFLLFSKRPEEALKKFRDVWEREPGNGYAVRGMVRSYQALDQLTQGISFFEQYRESHPDSSAAAYALGYIFYLKEKFKESENALRKSIQIESKNVLALNTLGAVLTELEQYDEALRRIKEAIAIAPEELMFYRNLQMVYIRSGKPGQFESDYRRYLEEGDAIQAKGYGMVLAQILRQKSFKLYVEGKTDDTINTLMDMLALYREINHKPGIVAGLFSLAVLYEEQGKRSLALEKYREVLKINPQHIQAGEKVRNWDPEKE